MARLLRGLERDRDFLEDVELGSRGPALALPRWRVMQHVILHGMQHQNELVYLLTAQGQSPGDIDFIFFRITSP